MLQDDDNNDDNEEKKDALKSDKLEDNDNANNDDLNNKICMNVCKTTAAAKGWVSPRIFMNIVGIKYCKITNEYCTISTFCPDQMLTDQFKKIYKVTDKDLKDFIVGKNLSLYLGVTRIKDTDYTKVTYILQSNNGGWLPQWAVEMGMVDQHMIAIFKKMTVWLLQNKKDDAK